MMQAGSWPAQTNRRFEGSMTRMNPKAQNKAWKRALFTTRTSPAAPISAAACLGICRIDPVIQRCRRQLLDKDHSTVDSRRYWQLQGFGNLHAPECSSMPNWKPPGTSFWLDSG